MSDPTTAEGAGLEAQSRWRAGHRSATGPAKGAGDRVKRSHAQTRTTVRFALAFFAAAAVTAAVGDHRWLALHLLFPGGVVLAISGVSLMLTVTWAAAPAPSDRWVTTQRASIIVGVLTIAVGRTIDAPRAVVAGGGVVFMIGLLILAALLAVTIRAGVERRFDAAVAAYLAATTAGLVGAALGVDMAVNGATPTLRAAHVVANLLGLVGLTIGGTLPFFAGTVGRSRMAKRTTTPRLLATISWQVVMLGGSVIALATGAAGWAATGLAGYAVGIVVALVWMPVPTSRQLEWAGPRLYALWAGGLWWCGAVTATALEALDDQVILSGKWLLVLAIAGYCQIAWGSLAYLLPMLRGGGPKRLGEGFAATRSWLGFAAVNLAGAALVLDRSQIAAAAVVIWVLDGAVRVARVGTTRHQRPGADPVPPQEPG